MLTRDFSDSIKLSVLTENMKKNNGDICCATCGKKLLSISECHFDHIFPFAKGGKSSVDNCQILCSTCNLKKTDKELQDFLLEEKAKRFLAGTDNIEDIKEAKSLKTQSDDKPEAMTKDRFDQIVLDFIARKGDIHKVDFSREYNHLPSIHYLRKYYSDLASLKKTYGIDDLSTNWNRETIKEALNQFVEQNGDILQRDLTKKNRLPSLPCILQKFPEYRSFTDIKQKMLGLPVRAVWDYESVLQAGKAYVEKNGKITESNLCSENGLPHTRVIYNYFGSLAAFQDAVGSEISQRNEYISEEEIEKAVSRYFGDEEREVESMKSFFEVFPFSPSTIHKRFGSFSAFCQKYNITVRNSKKAKYTKQEVDDAIASWVKAGKSIPTAKDLTKSGLPCLSVIMKYYEDWKEPFVLYQKMCEKLNA